MDGRLLNLPREVCIVLLDVETQDFASLQKATWWVVRLIQYNTEVSREHSSPEMDEGSSPKWTKA